MWEWNRGNEWWWSWGLEDDDDIFARFFAVVSTSIWDQIEAWRFCCCKIPSLVNPKMIWEICREFNQSLGKEHTGDCFNYADCISHFVSDLFLGSDAFGHIQRKRHHDLASAQQDLERYRMPVHTTSHAAVNPEYDNDTWNSTTIKMIVNNAKQKENCCWLFVGLQCLRECG